MPKINNRLTVHGAGLTEPAEERKTVNGTQRTVKNKIDRIQMSRSRRGVLAIEIREACDRVFSDPSLAKEQVGTGSWLESAGSDAEQVW